MSNTKVGARLKSAVCSTEVMVIISAAENLDIGCGGAAMLDAKAEATEGGTPSADLAQGSLMGKRYVNEAGDLELLCVKPGEGSISLAGVALVLKDAKPLPSSD